MSSLSKKCGNYKFVSALECVPAKVPVPNFSKIEKSLEELERQELETEAKIKVDKAVAKAALKRIRTARLKLKRLRKQRRLLKNKERKLFNSSLAEIEEIKALKAQE